MARTLAPMKLWRKLLKEEYLNEKIMWIVGGAARRAIGLRISNRPMPVAARRPSRGCGGQ